jgi:hypothetical protein
MFFKKSGPEDQIKKHSMYCVIKCVKTKRVLKGNFASSVFHSCNAKTQKTQICVTGPQCVNYSKFLKLILFLFQMKVKECVSMCMVQYS